MSEISRVIYNIERKVEFMDKKKVYITRRIPNEAIELLQKAF